MDLSDALNVCIVITITFTRDINLTNNNNECGVP